MHDFYSEVSEIYREYFSCVKVGKKYDRTVYKIQPNMYKKALEDYMLFGKVTRYPEKFIYRWKYYILQNTAYLEAMTDIGGHSSCFPFDEFNDVFFDGEQLAKDYEDVCHVFEEKDEDNLFPTWSNGQWFLSDYAVQPLASICMDLIAASDPTQILILINKALDVVHQRSDVAELFIHGGSDSLYEISNNN